MSRVHQLIKYKNLVMAVIIFMIALLLRVSILSQGLTYIDRMFLPDDTYYALSIARNISAGIGPSVNGEIVTSGFQPLVVFLMVPVYLSKVSSDLGVFFAVVMSSVFGAMSCSVFCIVILKSTESLWASFISGLMAATSPLVFRNDLNGLETSLAMLMSATSILLFMHLREDSRIRSHVILGVAIGLMILSRVDTAIIAFVIGVCLVSRFGIVKSMAASIIALVVVSPWWIYCAINFGSPVPESGPAVRQLIEIAGDQRMSMNAEVRLAISTLLGVVHMSSLTLVTSVGILLLLTIGAFVALLLYRASSGVAIMAICGLALAVFYIFYLPAFWFFHRYLHFLFFSIIACVIALPAVMFRNIPSLKNSVMIGLGFFMVAMNINGMFIFYSKPVGSLYGGVDGAKGYREVAKEILSIIPDGVTIGSPQSGALSYYASRDIRVVNLDGVVNKFAFEAIRSKTLADFIVSQNVNYIAGWDVNMIDLKAQSTRALTQISLSEIGRFKPQKNDQFVLYTVITP